MLKHWSDEVCTLLLHAACAVTGNSQHNDFASSRRLPASHTRRQRRQKNFSSR